MYALVSMQDVPVSFVHEPWKMSQEEQHRSNCVIGEDYPQPLPTKRASFGGDGGGRGGGRGRGRGRGNRNNNGNRRDQSARKRSSNFDMYG